MQSIWLLCFLDFLVEVARHCKSYNKIKGLPELIFSALPAIRFSSLLFYAKGRRTGRRAIAGKTAAAKLVSREVSRKRQHVEILFRFTKTHAITLTSEHNPCRGTWEQVSNKVVDHRAWSDLAGKLLTYFIMRIHTAY